MQPIVRHAVKISYHLTTVRQCGILVRASQVKRTAVISYRRLTQSLVDTWAGSGGRWVKAGAVGLVRGKGIRMDVCSPGPPWMRRRH